MIGVHLPRRNTDDNSHGMYRRNYIFETLGTAGIPAIRLSNNYRGLQHSSHQRTARSRNSVDIDEFGDENFIGIPVDIAKNSVPITFIIGFPFITPLIFEVIIHAPLISAQVVSGSLFV